MTGRAPVYLWILFLAACAAVAWRADYTADLSAFLPRHPTPSQRILVDQLRAGVVSQVMLVALDGAPPEQLGRLSTALAERLAHFEEFAFVSNGASSQMEADGKFLLEHRYLLSAGVTPERFTEAGLRAALEEDLTLLASPMGSLVNRVLPSDPTGEFVGLVERFALGGGPNKQHDVWFSRDGKQALLLAQTRAPGFDIDGQERALQRLHAAFDQLKAEQRLTGAQLVATGPGIFAISSRASIEADVSRISVIAVVLVSALLLAVYRSPRLLLLTLLPVVTGALAGIAAVSIAFASVHGITLGFGVTLLGEGVDYAIYLFTNATAGSSAARANAQLWRTLRLGVLTSVCGFGVMLLSDFTGLAQLGLLSIVGLIVAFGVTRLVLPQLSPSQYQAQPPAGLGPLLVRLAQAAPKLRYALAVMLAGCAALLATHGDLWDDRLGSLSPVPEADQKTYERLQRELGAPDARYLIVVTAPDQQAALEQAEQLGEVLDRLQQSGTLGGYDSPAQVLPSERTQRQRQQALPDAAVVQSRLDAAARGLPFRVDSFQPFLEDIAKARTAPLLQPGDLAQTALKVKFDSLLAPRADGWMAMLSLRDVRDASALAAALDQMHLTSIHLLDVKQEVGDLYRSYRGQALRFALIGAAAIALLLLVSLRSVKRAWEVLLPLAAALLATTALLTLDGRQLTMFHLVGMLLVIGVGSNYTLFFERRTFAQSDPLRTVTSLVLCNTSTVIGFGLLALARAPVLNAIGATVALGAFLSLVFSAVLARRHV